MRWSSVGGVALLFFATACSSSRDVASTSMATSGTPGTAPSSADSITGAAGEASPALPEPEAPAAALPEPVETPLLPGPGESTEYPLALDECGLNTGYPGDEQCILPPPPDQGFQIHIGPSDYANIDPQFIMAPHQESTRDFPSVSSNTTDIFFYYRQYRMRPGAHHAILSRAGATVGGGRRIGTANLPGDSPPGGVIAPENQGVGIPLGPATPVNVSFHAINVTNEPILQEIWVNFWYRNPAEVTEQVNQLFETGDVAFAIQPGEEVVLGPYGCDIPADGRVLWFYGHRHANNLRFSTWRERGGVQELFYEGLHWEEPLWLEYASNVQNPVPNREMGIEGGWSGVLDLRPGDRLVWECHVRNQQSTVLRFTNETYLGEMCIMDAEVVGTNCGAGLGGFGFAP